jgi:hypothetical protein
MIHTERMRKSVTTLIYDTQKEKKDKRKIKYSIFHLFNFENFRYSQF